MRRLMEEIRSSRHALLTSLTLLFTLVSLGTLLVQQHNNYVAVVARMDANFRVHRRETARWFRAADRAMNAATERRNRLWGRMAEQIGVPKAEVDRILSAETPPIDAHSSGLPAALGK